MWLWWSRRFPLGVKKKQKYSDFWTEAFGNQSRKTSSVDLKRAFLLPGDALGFCRRDFETFWNLSGFVSACWERSRLPGQGGRALLSGTALLAQPALECPLRKSGARGAWGDRTEALIDHSTNKTYMQNPIIVGQNKSKVVLPKLPG